jgi:tRNA 2-thiouridine synthesizing protein A
MGAERSEAAITPVDCELDTCGLACPLPLLRLKKTLVGMERGHVVRVAATDPASVLDFGVFLEQSGHVLLTHWQESGTLFYLIRKG